jgi:hypothetical protein
VGGHIVEVVDELFGRGVFEFVDLQFDLLNAGVDAICAGL